VARTGRGAASDEVGGQCFSPGLQGAGHFLAITKLQIAVRLDERGNEEFALRYQGPAVSLCPRDVRVIIDTLYSRVLTRTRPLEPSRRRGHLAGRRRAAHPRMADGSSARKTPPTGTKTSSADMQADIIPG